MNPRPQGSLRALLPLIVAGTVLIVVGVGALQLFDGRLARAGGLFSDSSAFVLDDDDQRSLDDVIGDSLDARPYDDMPDPDTADLLDAPAVTPMTVRPELLNAEEVARAIMDRYPGELDSGNLDRAPELWLFISEDGEVLNSQLASTSGDAVLDDIALEVADLMRFSPAMNGDEYVRVWVRVPVELPGSLRLQSHSSF